jgi:trans-2,3-dihydro-3-hydroxyanthranilate isomerase
MSRSRRWPSADYAALVGTYRYVLVDVFTDEPLTGNALAVFTDARGLDTETMQAIARETNLSETTFVLPAEQGGTARVRIFTPRTELPFAGHPTLGTAWVLAAPLQLDVVQLELGVGLVPVVLERDDSGRVSFGRMRQPVPTIEPYAHADAVLTALGVSEPLAPVELYDNGVQFAVVLLGSIEEVGSLAPDMGALARLEVLGTSCVAGAGTRWKHRMFAPAAGVPEDPATGAAAGPVACHLCRHGLVPWGEGIEISQGTEIARPSLLHARVDGRDGVIEDVEVGGAAVIVARGELRV